MRRRGGLLRPALDPGAEEGSVRQNGILGHVQVCHVCNFIPLYCNNLRSYLYAPKDDCKHRAYWRELYTVEEADHLQSLITAAGDRNINFYYAISPGLDITYSNSKEVSGGSQHLGLLPNANDV